MKLDLASRESTRAFVEEYKGRGLPLHILINNAGTPWEVVLHFIETRERSHSIKVSCRPHIELALMNWS